MALLLLASSSAQLPKKKRTLSHIPSSELPTTIYRSHAASTAIFQLGKNEKKIALTGTGYSAKLFTFVV